MVVAAQEGRFRLTTLDQVKSHDEFPEIRPDKKNGKGFAVAFLADYDRSKTIKFLSDFQVDHQPFFRIPLE
ncbi:MAG: hypothetical protein JRC66_06590 [Deltaproteobacteria bacterium]|nr:hypothetical protein [Deltaproteobacteria bacterium]